MEVKVCLNNKKMGTISLNNNGLYSFHYDREYVASGGRMFRELGVLSETLFPVFSNALPEGERKWIIESFLRSKEPLDILSESIEGQNGFSFYLLPEPEDIDLSFQKIPESAKENIGDNGTLPLHVTIPAYFFRDIRKRCLQAGVKISFSGVQDKFVAVLDENELRPVQPGERGNVIIKPVSFDYPLLLQNEFVFMRLNDELFGDSPFSCLVQDPEKNDLYHYVVERFDIGDETWFEIAQLMGMTSENKYDSTTEKLFEFLKVALSDQGFQAFVDRYIFCYLTGNSDMHLKNFSISVQGNGQAKLSPAYDLLCTKAYGDGDRLALPLNGDCRPGVKTFVEWLSSYGDDIPERAVKIASYLPERLPELLDAVPGFDGKNVRWRKRIEENVIPVCDRILKEFGRPDCFIR